MQENKHHNHHRSKWKKWYDNNKKHVIVLLVLFIIASLAFFYDKKSNKVDYNIENQNYNYLANNKKDKYDAIITILDGEGESSFTEIWGELINEGYPICSNLVPNNIGKEGFMDWETIEALNNIGIEFNFHTCVYDIEYNYQSIEDTIKSIENGIKVIDEHNLQHKLATWTSGINKDVYQKGKKYFEGGFGNANSVDTVLGKVGNSMNIQYRSNASNYSYEQLIGLINAAIENNGWLVLFTRNTDMNSAKIDIYRQAFEYAKKHNVAVVTASEGYDLYYGNKLGNH